ncbi:hypothetical protein [Mucilaginibacter sp. KACC 22063]|uniref:hypothetical protein n=1 Tax=Mucilaginibacter sp. KACC 22063 TaxID=3025666 RepID=UPI0023658CE9|nr:hypothetical protein [Mucilaginibacter sp. KACC 22063]WDF57384.1 hypothetical protein PQ461_09985 [Mucilaginibacter sp. KACC 22063]
MAKDIKAIQCPKCGSTFKKEIKPDFYQCQNCQTEYYLDSDDIHHYHHHERLPPIQSSAPPGNARQPLYILLGSVAFICIIYFVVAWIRPANHTANTYSTGSNYKPPRSYSSSFVYTNTATGKPVYLRVGADYTYKDDKKYGKELHMVFNDPLTGGLIADRIVNDEVLTNNNCMLAFKTYSPDLTYAIGCSTVLLQLDTRNNRLINITQSEFKDYKQLSSGVAKLEFDYYKPMINVINNEGSSCYYFPTIRKMADSNDEADHIWKKQFDQHYFEFGNMGDFFDQQKEMQLLEVKYLKQTGQNIRRNLTPGRKYFNPEMLYQDQDKLLFVVNTTPAPDPPVSIQLVDAKTGKLLWALAPDRYNLYSATKWKHGFAVEYRKGAEADYVHGVLVISDAGKIVHNYQLSRTE